MVVPVEMAVAKPVELIVATPVDEDDQVVPAETSSVPPSARVPAATNCSVPPTCTEGLDGEMLTDTIVLFATKNEPPHPLMKQINSVPESFAMNPDLRQQTIIKGNHTVTPTLSM